MSRGLFAASVLALSTVAFYACNSQPIAPAEAQASVSPDALAARGGRAATTGVIFVTSQGLYYDTFATKDPLPMHGKFQKLVNGTTEFGPGDPEYLGGRWWEDLNGDGVQNAGDHFFLCPLLPPGRATP